MKSINKSLLVAAVLSGALSALAQNPGGQNPGSGSTSPDPSNETRGRTGVEPRSETDANTQGLEGTGRNPNTVEEADRERNMQQDDMNQPKKKRSFWDRLFGRNKHLDGTNQNIPDRTTEPDASGRRIETQP